ncbi:Glutamate synthase [NADPH] large chain [Hydrogenovibrio crunogenus]|uniref:Glutamate synthase [NADPH] large chain n=1 Tax=Hydrogenovibrio crunogenus TaxID=39765 RepID=A0A4P7P1P9_9GAMM|nr:glutamate synthase large subunit [Hydrogenovibrio crunogenus]QBZ83998.1 Glutamate synthase [NADPH] large chain [Hydrogenovibrio crunogenus]
MNSLNSLQGLYSPEFERENCGFGMIAQMDDKPSHWAVQTAIESLANMTHRGGVAADCCTGDGCGLLIKKPNAFLRQEAKDLGFTLSENYASGMIFLNQDADKAAFARAELEKALESKGLSIAGWRKVPVASEVLGAQAAGMEPLIEQVYINAPVEMSDADFNRALFVARRKTEMAVEPKDETFYIASLHSQLISYKGLVMPKELPEFYLDLKDERFESSLISYHQRFSTNTLPQWRLAQPFRFLAHNGELNTIKGNRNWALARQSKFETPLIPELSDLKPLVAQEGSDSNSLDNMLEVLMMGDMPVFQALRLLIPPAWQNMPHMDPDLKAFLEYNSMHMEPWDGPAGMVINTGKYAICGVDRNGLRPTRYVITKDRHITFASEIGVYNYAPEDVVEKGRLKPGQVIAVDLEAGKLLKPEDIDAGLKAAKPYREWMDKGYMHLEERLDSEDHTFDWDSNEADIYQKYYQVTFEERDQVIRVLAEAGQEATGSMGDDAPLPVFSHKERSVFDYFRQMFAQVTNPPIDPLRENIVMSLNTCFGRELNMFDEGEDHARRLESQSPILSPSMMKHLTSIVDDNYRNQRISLHYTPENTDLKAATIAVCEQAVEAVKNGVTLLILSDLNIEKGLITVPAAMATGAVHHRLIAEGLRPEANIIVETGTARDPHHFAVLFGYGATAVYPYLAYESLQDMIRTKELDEKVGISEYIKNYRKGINKGLFKILSKMGISTITSYRGSQLFEAVGLSKEIVDLCFKGTPTRIEGTRFEHLQADLIKTSKYAFNPRKFLQPGGLLKYVHGGEYHAYNPDVVNYLREAVQKGDQIAYNKFAKLVNERPAMTVRDLIGFKDGIKSIDLSDVEPVESIYKRFDSAGISLGALSPEAHEALAIAMNRIGARSNSGEGAEDPARYGTEKMSKIKQIASGRFGVTAHYLRNAEVLQIKVAQGAKPGEGGQLPGHKVDATIAKLRHSVEGVTLISPPPHHDIYSIEDLAQLIFDLKQVNPNALVSVKLVAEPGVGTIAAGVAKAYADLITISGYDGGTGASPLTSVKYAGNPFEMGLAEAHQVLRANDLRGQVILQADGGLKTGLDVIKAAILGAESFGFGTAPMVALGCKYLRICHLNTCAVGVATQDERLRKEHFIGMPEMVINYFRFVAEETREWLAKLGVAKLEDLVGRVDLLKMIDQPLTDKQNSIDLTPFITDGGVPENKPQTVQVSRNNPWDDGHIAEEMVKTVLPAIENKTGGEFGFHLVNTGRSIGARIAGEIAQRYGNHGMKDAPITLSLTGIAGQSFGVFNVDGLNLHLQGDANDYVGKGMSGGEIVVRPVKEHGFDPHNTPIVGNTCLYGATGGKLFANGTGGERFAVRNSGATAVVEGLGDHGCEYMTGGCVVSLGQVGVNFGAGMSGGMAFILDLDRTLPDRLNTEMVEAVRIDTESTEAYRVYLQELLTEYVEKTGSQFGQEVIDNFSRYLHNFWLVKSRAINVDKLLDLFAHGGDGE